MRLPTSEAGIAAGAHGAPGQRCPERTFEAQTSEMSVIVWEQGWVPFKRWWELAERFCTFAEVRLAVWKSRLCILLGLECMDLQDAECLVPRKLPKTNSPSFTPLPCPSGRQPVSMELSRCSNRRSQGLLGGSVRWASAFPGHEPGVLAQQSPASPFLSA